MSPVNSTSRIDAISPPAENIAGDEQDERFAHLSEDDRLAVLEILRETKPGLPDYFVDSAN